MLDRLSVTPVFSLEPEFFDTIYELMERKPNVLVIDNLATLFRDGLMGATAQGRLKGSSWLTPGHAAIVAAMEEVNSLTYQNGMLTIVKLLP